MLTETPTIEEIEFLEDWTDSQALAECLFSNGDNLSAFDENKFIEIRPYQLPYLSWEYGLDLLNPNFSEKKKMEMREKVGNVIALGGRLHGKTFCVELIDLVEYFVSIENETCGFSSFDFSHIIGVLDEFIKILKYHPIVSSFSRSINRGTSYKINSELGVTLESVNQNIADGNRAGDQFYQKHFKKLFIEEQSRETEKVYEKRIDSRHELGCVLRLSGMTNFTKHSVSGKLFFDEENKKEVINLPQYVNPYYDEKEEQKAIKKYNGKQSIGFRVFVDGEVIEEGITALDMLRIRENCYPHKRDGSIDESVTIKNFEINSKTFYSYRGLLIVERPTNADRVAIAADIGDIGGTTEIIIMVQTGNKWRYTYNVTLRNLDNRQNKEILKYLYLKTNADYISLDTTDGSGKAIFRDLQDDKEIDSKKLYWCSFNENIEVGIEKDENGFPIRENGKLITKFENTIIWAVQRLCYLLYESLVFIPIDYKFDDQFGNIVSIPRGKTISYECVARENHLWSAWQVFAILQWKIEFSGFNKKSLNETFKKKHINCGA